MATVPEAPTPIALDKITPSSMRYRFSGNGNGGSPILEWQLGYGPDSGSGAYNTGGSWGTVTVPGLAPYTRYYFWARGRNDVGWGPWSTSITAVTLSGARVKSDGVWKEAVPYVKVGGIWKVAQPYIRTSGTWKMSG